ncbi:MAG: hypothetical protein AAGF30_12485 [Pseudomonadota bacterium]
MGFVRTLSLAVIAASMTAIGLSAAAETQRTGDTTNSTEAAVEVQNASAVVLSTRDAILRPSVPRRGVFLSKVGQTVPVTRYRPVWEDGRLNPERGPRTAEGNRQQAQIWTSTVPSTLVRP